MFLPNLFPMINIHFNNFSTSYAVFESNVISFKRRKILFNILLKSPVFSVPKYLVKIIKEKYLQSSFENINSSHFELPLNLLQTSSIILSVLFLISENLGLSLYK